MKTFDLEPLNKKPLYSQIDKIMDKVYNIQNYSYSDIVRDGFNYKNTINGDVYICASLEDEQAYKDEKKRLKEEAEETARHKYDHIKHPFIDYNNTERWKAGLKESEKQPYIVVEMCEDAYDHFMNCLPPKMFNGNMYMCSEANSHNEHGQGVYICGVKIKGKYYAQHGTVQEYREGKLFKQLPTY